MRSLLPIIWRILFVTLGLNIAGADTPQTGKASIWEVRDQDNVVYLAGSVHLLRKQDLPIPASYYQVYEDSKHIHFELDMGLISKPEMKLKMMQMGILPAGEELADFLSDKTLKRLRSHISAKGIPVQILNRMKPGMVVITLAALTASDTGASPENGIETLIFKRCVQDGKSTSGLETPEFQFSMFDQLENKTIDRLINETIDDADSSAGEIDKLLAAWKKGDSKALAKLISESSPDDEEIHKIIITDRNLSWMPTIEKAIKGSRNEMFVVGAGHLIGEKGILEMLEEKGYQVTQLGANLLSELPKTEAISQ